MSSYSSSSSLRELQRESAIKSSATNNAARRFQIHHNQLLFETELRFVLTWTVVGVTAGTSKSTSGTLVPAIKRSWVGARP